MLKVSNMIWVIFSLLALMLRRQQQHPRSVEGWIRLKAFKIMRMLRSTSSPMRSLSSTSVTMLRRMQRWRQQQHPRVSHLEEVMWEEREIVARQDQVVDSNSSARSRILILEACLGFQLNSSCTSRPNWRRSADSNQGCKFGSQMRSRCNLKQSLSCRPVLTHFCAGAPFHKHP